MSVCLFPYVRKGGMARGEDSPANTPPVHLINQSVCVEWMGRSQYWLSRRSPLCHSNNLMYRSILQYGIVIKKFDSNHNLGVP